jgi:excisionase family DNA binding protein
VSQLDRTTRHLVSIPDAAEYAGVSPRTIRRRITDGSLAGYRMGPRLIRVDLGELDALLSPIVGAPEVVAP